MINITMNNDSLYTLPHTNTNCSAVDDNWQQIRFAGSHKNTAKPDHSFTHTTISLAVTD